MRRILVQHLDRSLPVEISHIMSVRVCCPNGHWMTIDDSSLGRETTCPSCGVRCFSSGEGTPDRSHLAEFSTLHAKGRRRSRDDDDDEEEEDDDDDDDDRRSRSRRKAASSSGGARRRSRDDDDEDEEDDEKSREEAKKRKEERRKKKEEEELFGELKLDKELVRKKGKRYDQMETCSRGLAVVQYSIGLYLLASLCFGATMVLYSVNPNNPESNEAYLARTAAMIAGGVAAVAMLTYMVGICMNLVVPPKAEAKGLITVCVSLEAIVFALAIAAAVVQYSSVMQDPNLRSKFVGLLIVGAVIAYLASFVTLTSYLRRVCEFLNDFRLASGSMMYAGFNLLLSLIFGALAVASQGIVDLSLNLGEFIKFVFAGLFAVDVIAMLIFNIKFIFYVKKVRANMYKYIWEEQEIFD